MRRAALTFSVVLLSGAGAPASLSADSVQVTIYNRDFALIKETRSVTLKEGIGEVRFGDVTSLLEPDSVVLRDRKDPGGLRILEQNYEGDPLGEESLLRRYEGKIMEFRTVNPATGAVETTRGRLIRSGYQGLVGAWQSQRGWQPIGLASTSMSPIVEIGGKILFALPGQPLFEPLGSDAILKPTLLWKLWSDRGGSRDLEVSYLTGGLRWEATYNLVVPEKGDRFDLVGWVTLENESGAEFRNARVKLMAGDVSKVQPGAAPMARRMLAMEAAAAPGPPVTEKAFDEYHLYTLTEPTTLREREIKQVEFCRGDDVPGQRLYVYDGAQLQVYGGYDVEGLQASPQYGTQGSGKVSTMIEFKNSKEAGLGMPLPRGTMKLYRADTDGSREFIGENVIDHTPADETIRLSLGNAFDLKGERRQTDFKVDTSRETASEAFEIKIRNHKKEAVEVRVVEHLYRWATWKVAVSSDPYEKTDARTIEFRVKVAPDAEKVVTYRVNYSW